MERPSLGFLLAFMAGTMDAWTLHHASTFATVQSGNLISSGYYLIQGGPLGTEPEKFIFPALSVLAFGIGSAVCGAVMTSLLRKHKVYTPWILLAHMLILLGLATVAILNADDISKVAPWIAYGVSFVAGSQGNAWHKTHGMLYGNVAITFVVQMAFNFAVQSLFSKKGIQGEPNLMWSGLFFLVLLGFASGAGVGFLANNLVGPGSLLLTVVLTGGIAVIAWRDRGKLPAGIDPTPGGQFA